MIPEYIIVHCSATEDGRTLSWDDIRRFHIFGNGWSNIGYHFGIEEVEGKYMLLQGRRPDTEGAHCRAAGRNHDSLGVCLVGDFHNRPVPPAKYQVLVKFLAELALMFHIPPDKIKGHREYESGKTCPGLAIDLDVLRDDVKLRLMEEGGEVLCDISCFAA